MKLILASSGFESKEAVKKCVELVGKPAKKVNFAIINEAYAVEHGDHHWILDDIDSIRKNFGGNIEFVNLLALSIDKIEESINASDVIFVIGGNTEYLKTVFDKTGFSKLLPKLLKDKVYIGSSAGSMILGRQPSYKTQDKIYGKVDYFGVHEYLNILKFSILPHLHSKYFSERADIWAIKESENVDYPVYAISDHAAVIVDGNQEYVVGHDYIKLLSGKEIDINSGK